MPYPTAVLPPRPSLALLSNRAKELRKAHARSDGDAIQRILDYHPAHAGVDSAGVAAADLSLRDAQLVVAREHGFENWAELKRYVAALGHEAASDAPSTYLSTSVPFFGVADMQRSLAHYQERLGFQMARNWAPEGEVRWCWLERGRAALMLQQYETEGPNARTFVGRRGEAAAFALVTDRATNPLQLLDTAQDIVDGDGYVLRDPSGVLQPDGSTATVVPVLDASNLARSNRFYREILGFHELDGRDGEWGWLRRDDVDILLRQEAAPPERRGQGLSIFHRCHDAPAFYREVTTRGGAMREPVVGNRMWETEVRDPDGWRLSFGSPTDHEEETRLSQVGTAAQ